MSRVLVTGAAGFIGAHVSRSLLERGDDVWGLDNLNEYYDVQLKWDRLDLLHGHSGFHFERMDLTDGESVLGLFESAQIELVVHLAAQAGVRYSLTHPEAYIGSNLVGFAHILEGCRQHRIRHLVFASSSSVYGANREVPFSVRQRVDHPVSLYAATKRSNELMAHAYSHLYRLPTTGLRFFTVYGPWGRPDMAYFLFTRAILEGRPIQVFNHGAMQRDFTYIDDIVEGVLRTLDRIPEGESSVAEEARGPVPGGAPYKLYNIGNNRPVHLTDFIRTIEEALGRTAIQELLPMQPGDIVATCADIEDLVRDVGFRPSTPIEEGVRRFVEWYREYYKV